MDVHRYPALDGSEPFTDLIRIERVALGNFGDASYLREGVWELRIDFGPGYRVYFGREGETSVTLLCGGDKRNQDADIERAIDLWQEHERRRSAKPGRRR